MLNFLSRSGQLYRLTLLLGILLLTGCGGNEAAPPIKPNILFILVDDLGNNDIASWGDGQAPTPTLDHLSQQSVRFRHHYTDSTCSPSRASLLTGKRAVEAGFQPIGLGLSPDLLTLPKSLKAIGYRTIHLGKWHVGEALEYPEIQPDNQGFDYWWGALNHFVLSGPAPDGTIRQGPPTHIDPWLQENGEPPRQYKGHVDDLLVEKAIALIQQSDDRPWFINLWLHSPHVPYQPSPKFKAQFPDTPEGHHLAVLKQLDYNVLRLLESLEQRGTAADTIVVFASDNGEVLEANNFPLQGKKATYMEGGVRSPLLLRWPSHFAPSDIHIVSDIADLFPTIVAMVGGKVPSGLSGRDLSPALHGKPPPERLATYWASNAGQLGMTFAGALFAEGRYFYSNPFSGISTHAITPPIGLSSLSPPAQPLQSGQAHELIAKWERSVRKVPLIWTEASHSSAAHLSGRDFQRAPVFAGYSMGLELYSANVGAGEQTLVYQEGVWALSLDDQQRFQLKFGDVMMQSAPVTLHEGCNTLIASFDVQSAYTHPFPRPAHAQTLLYLNGQEILNNHELLRRPSSATPLANPTFIGARPDGSAGYRGRIAPPLVINKMLLPKQDGYQLRDMLAEMCKGKGS